MIFLRIPVFKNSVVNVVKCNSDASHFVLGNNFSYSVTLSIK